MKGNLNLKLEYINIFPTPKNGVVGYFLSDISSIRSTELLFGTHNGYVILAPNHPLSGMHYNDIYENCIYEKYGIEVHGGITFSNRLSTFKHSTDFSETPELLDYQDYWVLGFDTQHAGDDAEKWNAESTLKETELFAEQLMKIS
jgi:hypothetical protein